MSNKNTKNRRTSFDLYDDVVDSIDQAVVQPIRDIRDGAMIKYRQAVNDPDGVASDFANAVISNTAGAGSIFSGLVPGQVELSRKLRTLSDDAENLISDDSLTKNVTEYAGNVAGGLGAAALARKLGKKFIPRLAGRFGPRKFNGELVDPSAAGTRSLANRLGLTSGKPRHIRRKVTNDVAKFAGNTMAAGGGATYLVASDSLQDAAKDRAKEYVDSKYGDLNNTGGLGLSDKVIRRILDYNPEAHKRMLDNTNDWSKIEDRAVMLGGRGVDYDYALIGERNKYGHSGDAGKLYNHPTFSNQSVFANKEHPGGKWIGRGENGSTEDIFFPSKNQMKRPGYNDMLRSYYEYEKGRGIDKIVYPDGTIYSGNNK